MASRYIGLVCLSVVVVTFILPSYAWGPDGHEIVAEVGYRYLTSTTQQQTSKILGSYSFSDVSTWPDNYDHTSEGKWSEHLHYVNLNQSDVTFTYQACEPPLADPAGCVITAIDNFTAILAMDNQQGYYDKCTDPNAEPCALSFLIHFLGDSHQPLHVAYKVDEGGNTYYVDYYGDCTELHSVWDSKLIYTYEDDNDIGWEQMADQILAWLGDNKNIVSDFTNSTKPEQWGKETFAAARFAPYNMSPASVPGAQDWVRSLYNYITPKPKTRTSLSSSCSDPPVPDDYYVKNIPVVFNQLAKAGVRLAYLLNTIYDPSFNGVLTQN